MLTSHECEDKVHSGLKVKKTFHSCCVCRHRDKWCEPVVLQIRQINEKTQRSISKYKKENTRSSTTN